MSNLVNITVGTSTIGNSSNEDFDLVGLSDDQNVKTLKTLVNGKWKSWVVGTPEAYQGFSVLERGYGYVVKSEGNTSIDFGDTVLDMNNLTLSTGLSLLTVPYQNKSITEGGYIPRINASTVKTIDNTWKSWSQGVPAAYQGFSALTAGVGYVMEIEEVFDNYTDKTNDTDDTGVTLGKITNTINSSNIPLIEGLSNGLTVKSIEEDTLISVNSALPKKSMLIEIDGEANTLLFPQEFLGKKFTIANLNYTVIDLGLINTAPTKPTVDMGLINEVSTKLTDLGRIDAVQLALSSEYVYTFVENTSVTHTPHDLFVVDDIIEIMYNTKTYNSSVDKKVMNINLDGDLTRLSFAIEYLGDDFVIVKNDVEYTGVFTESENYIVL